ncbi:MAG: PIN domain-containing protein [Nitrososphaerales archaeon]
MTTTRALPSSPPSRGERPSVSGSHRHRYRRVRSRSSSTIRSGGTVRADHRGQTGICLIQTAAELRYGAFRRGWADKRMRELEARIGTAEIVHTGPDLILVYAKLRADCERMGHALAQRGHDADRWVAATALRVGIPLVSNDGIFDFDGAPGVIIESP